MSTADEDVGPPFSIVTMQPADVADVLVVQAQAYAGIDVLEDAALFLNRMHLSPASCWVARSPTQVLGYLVSYPWILGAPPPLNTPLARLPEGARSWYLHDCAVIPVAAGRGVGSALVRAGTQFARDHGYACASLVSLSSALPYWRRWGYETVASDHEFTDDYGAGACYMRCLL